MAISPFGQIPSRTRATAPAKSAVPPVSKSTDSFATDPGKEISYIKAIHALQQRAYKEAAAKKRKQQGSKKKSGGYGGFNIPTPSGPNIGPPPMFEPIVNPYQAIIAGIGGQVSAAQGRIRGQQGAAQASLANLGSTTEVPGASVGDVGSAAVGSLAGQGSDISGNLRSQMAQFIIRQIQQRQQIQADYLNKAQSAQIAFQQQNQFTPDMLRQLIASGIDPSSVDTSNPFAIAAALGKAQKAKSGAGSLGLSLSTITQLATAGIDPKLYEGDPEGAAIALGKSRRSQQPSQADILAILKAANS